MSDLRDRIAAALYDRWWHVSMSLDPPPRWPKLSKSAKERWLSDADAVIAELGLTIQVAGPDGIVGTGKYRYVTRWWTADD